MLIGQSPHLQRVKKMIMEIAKVDDSALIIGEVGVGKELIAHEIHRRSRYKNRQFVVINCTAVGDTITEGDLFGEKIESSQGIERKLGLLEQAQKGTLYLQNVDELDPSFQQHFLNMIKEKKFFKPSENKFVDVNFRVIATTTDEKITKRQAFRKDLYAALSAFVIKVPSLKERRQDIPLLFSHFLQLFCEEFDHEMPPVPADIFESLMEYEWVGNILELKNAV